MNLERLHFPNLKIPIAIAFGCLLAVGMGVLIGQGEFRQLKFLTYGAIFAVYALFLQHHTWKVVMFMCFLEMYFVGLGFKMGALEQTVVVASMLVAITWWRKVRVDRPAILEHWSFGFFSTALLVWLLYDIGHTTYNIFEPYNLREFSLKSMVKVAAQYLSPFLLLLYFCNRPKGLVLSQTFPVRLVQIIFATLSANIAIRVYQMATGRYQVAGESWFDAETSYFRIEWLGLLENVYAMRVASPLAMLVVAGFILTGWVDRNAPRQRWWFYLTGMAAGFAALISGGRGTIVFGVALVILATYMTGKKGLFFTAIAGLFGMVVFLNLASDLLKGLPESTQRPLQWLLVRKNEAVASTISESTNWRLTLFKRALNEWRSDRRIFWFGRATYSFSARDQVALLIGGEKAKQDMALRRGATHNLISDLLVIFGLVGFIIYMVLHVANFYFLWHIWRSEKSDLTAHSLALVCLIYFVFYLSYGVVGGSTYPAALVWLTIILVAYLWAGNRPPTLERRPLEVSTEGPRSFNERRLAPPRPLAAANRNV